MDTTTIVPSSVIAPPPGLIAGSATLLGRQNLRGLVTPPPTSTHKPIPHSEIIEALIETLAIRHLNVLSDAYAVTTDGNRMFGVLSIDVTESGVRFCIGVRNSHDRSMALSLVVGYHVLVCSNLAFGGDFCPILKRHSAKMNLLDVLSIGCDQMARNFEPMRKRLNIWQNFSLADDQARLIIYKAYVERDGLVLPRHLGPKTHELYFNPEHEEFKPRTLWSLENAFTSAIAELDDVPRFQAAAKIVPFLQQFS